MVPKSGLHLELGNRSCQSDAQACPVRDLHSGSNTMLSLRVPPHEVLTVATLSAPIGRRCLDGLLALGRAACTLPDAGRPRIPGGDLADDGG